MERTVLGERDQGQRKEKEQEEGKEGLTEKEKQKTAEKKIIKVGKLGQSGKTQTKGELTR